MMRKTMVIAPTMKPEATSTSPVIPKKTIGFLEKNKKKATAMRSRKPTTIRERLEYNAVPAWQEGDVDLSYVEPARMSKNDKESMPVMAQMHFVENFTTKAFHRVQVGHWDLE